jgi:Ca2+-binding RTX toxin-like protein
LDGNDFINGNTGNDVLNGNIGNDLVFGGQGNDTAFGGQGNDVVSGDLGDDSLMGDLGNDTLIGGAGNDTGFGGQGNDLLNGGDGNDVLSGDFGTDTLVGGAGNDLFILRTGTAAPTVAQADIISDYQVGVDIIGLTGNLTPAGLTVTTQGNSTVLSITATNQVLGVLTGQFTLQQLTFVSVELPNGLI